MPRGYKGRVVSSQEASRRWREKNPDKVKEANRRPRKRIYDPEKSRLRRLARLSRPGYRAKQNDLANTRAANIRRWLDAYKLSIGCIDCGYNAHHAALHFDHVRGQKLFNVCNAKSIEEAKQTITK